MNEEEWRSADYRSLLNVVKGDATDRQLRLLATAVAFRIPDYFHVTSELAIQAAMLHADGLIACYQLDEIREIAIAEVAPGGSCTHDAMERCVAASTDPDPQKVLEAIDGLMFYHEANSGDDEIRADEERIADFIRDIFPRPGVQSWNCESLPAAVIQLSLRVYNQLALCWDPPMQVPLLAELLSSLIEAKVDPKLIAHFQESDTHVRGCWVLDALLGFDHRLLDEK